MGKNVQGAELYDVISNDANAFAHPGNYTEAQWNSYWRSAGQPQIGVPGSDYEGLGRSTMQKAYQGIVMPALLEGGNDSSASMAEVLRDYLLGNPQVAEQQFGLTNQYLPQYANLLRGEISKDRAAGIGDVANLLPQVQAIDTARQRPETNAMMQMLYDQMGNELSQGGRLTPGQSAQVNESVRSGQIARGTSSGVGASNREAVTRALQSMDLLTARQGKAQNLINFDQTLKTNPYSAVLGVPTTATTSATGLASQGANTLSPNLYAQNVWNTNSNNLAQAQFNAQQQNQANMMNLIMANKGLSI